MKPGPKPGPTNRLNSWRAKARKEEPKPPKARPTCPTSLSVAAKRKFRQTVKHLESMNILTQVDGDAIAFMPTCGRGCATPVISSKSTATPSRPMTATVT